MRLAWFALILLLSTGARAEQGTIPILSGAKLCHHTFATLSRFPTAVNDFTESAKAVEEALASLEKHYIYADGLPDIYHPQDTVSFYSFRNPGLELVTGAVQERADVSARTGAISLAHPQRVDSKVWARSSGRNAIRGVLRRLSESLRPESRDPLRAMVLRGEDAKRFAQALQRELPEKEATVHRDPFRMSRDLYGLWKETTPWRRNFFFTRAGWISSAVMALAAHQVTRDVQADSASTVGLIAATIAFADYLLTYEREQKKVMQAQSTLDMQFRPTKKQIAQYPTLLPQDQLGSVLTHMGNEPQPTPWWRQVLKRKFLPEITGRVEGDWVLYSQRDEKTKRQVTFLYQFGAEDRLFILTEGE